MLKPTSVLSLRRWLGMETLEDRTQPASVNAHVPAFLDGHPGLDHTATFAPPGLQVVHNATAAAHAHVTFGTGSPPGHASEQDFPPIDLPGVGDPPGSGVTTGPIDVGDGGESGDVPAPIESGGNTHGSGAPRPNNSGKGGQSGNVGTGGDSGGVLTNAPTRVASSNAQQPITQATVSSPLADQSILAPADSTKGLVALPPDRESPTAQASPGETAVFTAPLTADPIASNGELRSYLFSSIATSSVEFAPDSLPVAPAPHTLLSDGSNQEAVELAPSPRAQEATLPSEIAETSTTLLSITNAGVDAVAEVTDAALTFVDGEEATPSNTRWWGIGGVVSALAAGAFWIARRQRLAWKADARFRRRIATLPKGSILSTDVETM